MEDEGLEYPFTAEEASRDLQRALKICVDTHICYEKLQQRTVGFKACFFYMTCINRAVRPLTQTVSLGCL